MEEGTRSAPNQLPPPATGKLRLVNHPRDQPRAQQGQQAIAIFRPEEMTRAGGKAAVEPVDAIQPLDEADTSTTEPQQAQQVPHAAGEQDCIKWSLLETIADLDATPGQPFRQLSLEGSNAAGMGGFGNDTNARHGGIIPYGKVYCFGVKAGSKLIPR